LLVPVVLSLCIIILLVMGYAVWVAHKKTLVERVPVFGIPAQLGLPWENVSFTSRNDEVFLEGWYLPSKEDNRCIILVQGTEHHRNSPGINTLHLGGNLVDRGFSVLLFDFRGRGESEGDRSSEGDREQWDLLGAIDYVESRGIPAERIGLLGFSLGAGVSILVAAQEPRIAAVVSDGGFLDYMMDLKLLSIGRFYLPTWFAYLVNLAGRVFFKTDFNKVSPIEVVDKVEQPIFFIHGEDDPVISAEESRELFVVSDNVKDRLWIVPRTEHVNIYTKKPQEYVERVSQFFNRYINKYP
jgi:dipeptidyl aminopeptidase/acylaminoacyl peptidase